MNPPILPWHYEAAKEINARLSTTHYINIAELLARHDPHAAQHADEWLRADLKDWFGIEPRPHFLEDIEAALSELAARRRDRERLENLLANAQMINRKDAAIAQEDKR